MIAAATLAGAWFFQLVLKIQFPVRSVSNSAMPIYLAVPLGALVALAAAKHVSRAVVLAGLVILALAALGNAGLGTYHAGVEWGLWQGPTECTGTVVDFGSASNLLERLKTVKDSVAPSVSARLCAGPPATARHGHRRRAPWSCTHPPPHHPAPTR